MWSEVKPFSPPSEGGGFRAEKPMKLSAVALKNAKPRDKMFRLADGGGLYVQIEPNGSKLWRMKYRFAGKEKVLAFGRYPDVSLADAREAREAAKRTLR